MSDNQRDLEAGIQTDLNGQMTYGGYLHLDTLLAGLKRIYEHRADFWPEYHMCEQLVDVEESFQLWRFRHMKTVERIIGHRRGTGGSSGVGFLKKALELEFFPELLDVRTILGS
jgi:tryptophan 2,3-dioxygenase